MNQLPKRASNRRKDSLLKRTISENRSFRTGVFEDECHNSEQAPHPKKPLDQNGAFFDVSASSMHDSTLSTTLSVAEINSIREFLRTKDPDKGVIIEKDEVEKLIQNDEPEEEQDKALLPSDTFSMFFTAPYLSSPFITSATILCLKITVFALILSNQINLSSSNPLGIPVSQTAPVIIAQYVALFITVATQDDVVTALTLIQEGFSDDLPRQFPDARKNKWIAAVVLLFFNGALGLVTTFLLIITSTNVIELLLNFTAVEFVSLLDNSAFVLAVNGLLGSTNRDLAVKISNTEYRLAINKSKVTPVRQIGILLFLYAVLVIGWSVVYVQQSRGKYTPGYIIVQFDDELLFELSALSGPYAFETSGTGSPSARIRYVSENRITKLGYCSKYKRWMMWQEGNDPCAMTIGRSAQTSSFNILDAAEILWEFTNDVEKARFYPMSEFQLFVGCTFDGDCGGAGLASGRCVNNQCKCGDGYFSLQCDYRESNTCSLLDSESEPLEGIQRSYDTKYDALRTGTNQLILFYERPIFLSTTEKNRNPHIIFFAGYRWVLTQTHRAYVEDGQNVTKANIKKFFETRWPNIDVMTFVWGHEHFVSQPIVFNTPGDIASPIGLRWYLVTETFNSHSPDSKSFVLDGPFDPGFFCAVCDDESNPCGYEGICQDDGRCQCLHGSSSSLCRVAPIGDGQCDTEYFNRQDFNFDSGDCCASTCISSDKKKCGIETLESMSAVYVGYPHCSDPETFCDNPTCYAARAVDIVSESSSASEMTMTLTSNGQIMAVSEHSLDFVRVFDQVDSRWVQRGPIIEGLRNTHFGRYTAIASSPAMARWTGRLHVIIATSFGRRGQSRVSVHSWGHTDNEWTRVGDHVDLCEMVEKSSCALRSLQLVVNFDTIQIVATLGHGVVIVVRKGLYSTDSWKLTNSFDGRMAAISEDGRVLSISSTDSSIIRSFFTEVEGSQDERSPPLEAYSNDLSVFGNETKIEDFRLSSDGSILSGVLSRNDATATLFHVSTAIPMKPRLLTEIDDYRASETDVSLSPDGSAVAVQLMHLGILRVYAYNETEMAFEESGSQQKSTYLSRRAAVSNRGKILALGGIDPIKTYERLPTCPPENEEFRLSITLADASNGVSWMMRSVKFVGNHMVPTRSLHEECDDCYGDFLKFSRALISQDVCVPQNECLLLNFVATEGFDDGAGMVLYQHDKIRRVLHDNSTDPVEFLSDNTECMTEEIQCGENEALVVLVISLDGHPRETSVFMSNGEEIIFDKQYSDATEPKVEQICTPSEQCVSVTFQDSEADGFCCQDGFGWYQILYDGKILVSKLGNFEDGERVYFGSCNTSVVHPVEASFIITVDERSSRTFWNVAEKGGKPIAGVAAGHYAHLAPPDYVVEGKYVPHSNVSDGTVLDDLCSVTETFSVFPGATYQLDFYVPPTDSSSNSSSERGLLSQQDPTGSSRVRGKISSTRRTQKLWPTLPPTTPPTTFQPSDKLSTFPSSSPSAPPSRSPTVRASVEPTASPSKPPSMPPTSLPSTEPTTVPTKSPSASPTSFPSSEPTSSSSLSPSMSPTSLPSAEPTVSPSSLPSTTPTTSLSGIPSGYPSAIPTGLPSWTPSSLPSKPLCEIEYQVSLDAGSSVLIVSREAVVDGSQTHEFSIEVAAVSQDSSEEEDAGTDRGGGDSLWWD